MSNKAKLLVAAALVGAWLMWRGVLFETRWYLRIAANSWWIGFVAVISGWVVAESGRQPWLVHRILRTADAISPVTTSAVATSLALFVAIYGIVFAAGIYYINRLINRGPEGAVIEPPKRWVPGRTLSAAEEAGREILSGRPRPS